MVITTRLVGVALVVLGILAYAATGGASATALIPTAFGAVIWALAIVARRERLRPHAMHAAAVVGLLGFLGTVRALGSLPALLQGESLARPTAVLAQSIMALVTGGFVALCVKSFIDARRRRKASSRPI